MTNKATWEEAVKLICSIRKGGMDDKQFEATVEHNISSLLLSQRKELMEAIEAERKPETKIADCENCGEEGWGIIKYGRGAPDDPHGYGNAYFPIGTAVLCKDCMDKNGKIGMECDGHEIWSRTSDKAEENPDHNQMRLNSITKKLPENIGYNNALTLITSILSQDI